MPNFLTPLYINQNFVHAPVVETLAADPPTPKTGQFYFSSVLQAALFYNGTQFVPADAAKLLATIPNTALAPSALNRANQNGVQLADTISNLSATVQAYTLDQFAPAAAFVSMGGNRLENVADPIVGTDAANMEYVQTTAQASAAGIVSKQAVAVVAVANVPTLSGLLTVDGITLVAGDRILLTAQTLPAQNGPYIVAASAWTRSINDANGELDLGATWFVEQGTAYASSTWRLGAPVSGPITPGSTSVTIYQLTAANTYSAIDGISLNGNTFSGVVVPLGGVLVDGTGFSVDHSIVTRKYGTSVGDGVTTSFVLTHNLATQKILVSIQDSSYNACIVDYAGTSPNTVTINFAVAPTMNQYFATIFG